MAADDGNDRTKLRIPGAQRPPATPPPTPAPPSPAELQRRPRSAFTADNGVAQPLYRPGAAHNPLLEAALPLLMLATRLRSSTEGPDVGGLQQRIADEIRSFEARARDTGVPAEDALAARYAICTTLDESVLNTPWGAQSGWAAQTLLILFYRESFGGEKVFQIIDRVVAEAGRYVNLMELLHACLAIGLEGRYRLDARGPARLADIQRDLYERIRAVRGAAPRELSPQWAGVTDSRPRLMRYVPWWIVATATVAIVLLAYIGFRSTLGSSSGPVNSALAAIGVEPMYVPGPGQTAGPRLAELLAPEVQAGRLQVTDMGNRTLVRLLQTDLFPSGSAEVRPEITATLRAIAAAVDRIPGRLLVVGHTDDQPVKSLRFADNFELSRARAQSVADMLRPFLARSGGIDVVGKGAEQPISTPVDRPENRARNRRVEIVHQAGL